MEELPAENLRLYEQYRAVIDKEIGKRVFRWKLTSLAYIDLSDIAQLLNLHVVTKIHLYDEEKSPFSHWVNRLLSNRLKNLFRDHYQAFAPPCDKCPFNGGGSSCTVFGKRSDTCSDYAHWMKNKRFKMEIAMAHSISAPRLTDEHDQIHQEINDKTSDFTDFETKIPEFQALLKAKLRPLEWRAYTYLFIDHMTDIQCAKQLGYETTGNKSSKGYKTVLKIKTKIYKTAQLIVAEMEF